MDVTKALETVYSGIAQASYYTFGTVNEGVRYLLSKMPMQSKNKFEILMYQPYKIGAIISSLSSIDDALITKLYLQSITVPNYGFEMERTSGETAGVKNLVYPESVTMTFLADQMGLTYRYLNSWRNDIAEWSETEQTYIFKDKQLEAKRDAVLQLTTDTGIPEFSGRFMFKGLNLKSIDDITIGHDENDNLIYTAQFSIDHVHFYNI